MNIKVNFILIGIMFLLFGTFIAYATPEYFAVFAQDEHVYYGVVFDPETGMLLIGPSRALSAEWFPTTYQEALLINIDLEELTAEDYIMYTPEE